MTGAREHLQKALSLDALAVAAHEPSILHLAIPEGNRHRF